MYYPYLRGKQYELIMVRENAHRMGQKIIPIIEPVKKNTGSLHRTLKSLIEKDCYFTVITNPRCGDFRGGECAVIQELQKEYLVDGKNWAPGLIVDLQTTEKELELVTDFDREITLVHKGYRSGADLVKSIEDFGINVGCNIFIDGSSSRLYRRHFKKGKRILIRDGFETRINREHPEIEHFSDLHVTFPDEGMDGFGDFLIVGDEYSDTGGPAYTVAIHLTMIDPDAEHDMFVKHYLSDSNSSPVDSAGKFAQALAKLEQDIGNGDSPILRSDAVEEFLGLHGRGHYPGLGYVKKLSMQHHIELLADYLRDL